MIYDTIIIGLGPAGLTASIYSSRYKLNNLIIGLVTGGTVAYAHKVDNFPGIPGISGVELGKKMSEQAKALGAEVLTEEVTGIEIMEGAEVGETFARVRQTCSSQSSSREHDGLAESLTSPCPTTLFKITTSSGKELEARTLIVASGTERRKLGVPGEKEYLGKGISYCTTCDAPFFKGKTVVLVGGSNAACSGAIHLSTFAEKIYLIYRKNALRAEPVWVEEVKENSKIEIIYETNVTEILGDGARVTGVKLDVPYNGNSELSVSGVFVEIGGQPASGLLKPIGVELDEDGYVKVDERMSTNIPGLFAAGDLTTHSLILQQVITACAGGAVAANSAFEYLKKVS